MYLYSDPSPLLQGGVDDVVLNNIQRYDKLNQILSLLQQARDEGSKEQEAVKLSRLRDQIMGALDEAVRLRAETEALQHKVGGLVVVCTLGSNQAFPL